jgi:hypothetical protein
VESEIFSTYFQLYREIYVFSFFLLSC